jgi:inositol hexakisphosphate/diphosphoinositol-pentakisphosphate kinase
MQCIIRVLCATKHACYCLLQVRVRQPALLALFAKHADSKGKQAKLKSPAQLQELLDICRSTLAVSCRGLKVLSGFPAICLCWS